MMPGDVGVFYLDASAVLAGQGIPAEVLAVDAGPPVTVTVSVAGDPRTVYGPLPAFPAVPSPYYITYNTDPVGTTPSGAGYYFELAPAMADAQANITALDAATTAAALSAANNLTPLVIQPVSWSGTAWTYDQAGPLWHQRFSVETLYLQCSAPASVTAYRVKVKDLAGGPMSINVAKAPRVAAPAPASWTAIAATQLSSGSGLVQTVNVPLSALNGESLHRIAITTGASNGGVLPATQYHAYEIYPEV